VRDAAERAVIERLCGRMKLTVTVDSGYCTRPRVFVRGCGARYVPQRYWHLLGETITLSVQGITPHALSLC
jgi:hypothetical protein